MRIFFRTLWASLWRFVLVFALAVFVQRFDVSPLPIWTLFTFAYLAQALFMYGATYWVLKKRPFTRRAAWWTVGSLTLLQIFFECLFFLGSRGWRFTELGQTFNEQTIYLAFLYLVAGAFAVGQLRHMSGLRPIAPVNLLDASGPALSHSEEAPLPSLDLHPQGPASPNNLLR